MPKSDHQHKKVKRDHSPLINAITYDNTPPPSPPPEGAIDYAEIKDEIVSGVVSILETTGNRPHTVKELAAVLAPTTSIVEKFVPPASSHLDPNMTVYASLTHLLYRSANPQAIISSRLNAYLRRNFSRSSPCLLKKITITTHPKRIYFYLATSPHQPIPKYESEIPQRSIVSPELSDDEDEHRYREDSPEVDLSSHEWDDEADSDSPDTSFDSTASSVIRERTRSPSHRYHNMDSAPLEGDEREFTRSALFIGRRSMSAEKQISPSDNSLKRSKDEYDSDGSDEQPFEDAAGTLLGYSGVTQTPRYNGVATMLQEATGGKKGAADLTIETDFYSNWSGELERHLGSPEAIDLDELDNLLDF